MESSLQNTQWSRYPIQAILAIALATGGCSSSEEYLLEPDETPMFEEGEHGVTAWDFGNGQPEEIAYAVQNGFITYDGDMVLGTVEEARARQEAAHSENENADYKP